MNKNLRYNALGGEELKHRVEKLKKSITDMLANISDKKAKKIHR